MAKENNLHDLLVGIGDAIRTKEGTTEEINPQDFQTRIENLPSGGGVDLKRIGYTDEDNQEYNDYIENGLKYAEQIARDWVDEANLKDKYHNNNIIIYFPKVKTDNATNIRYMFGSAYHLQIVGDLTSNEAKECNYSFSQCFSLISMGNLGLVKDFYYTFNQCYALESVGIIDLISTIRIANPFAVCPNLINVKISNYKQFDLYIKDCANLSIECINYLIENAVTAADGAEQRTLTLHATAKARWQDPNQNPQYEYYAAMAAEKLITIA